MRDMDVMAVPAVELLRVTVADRGEVRTPFVCPLAGRARFLGGCCQIWEGRRRCRGVVVETLWHFNPLCGGGGDLPVCAKHLAEHWADHLLEARR